MSPRTKGVLTILVLLLIGAGTLAKRSKPASPTYPQPKLKWQFSSPYKVWFTSPAIGPDSTVYLTNEVGLIALDAKGAVKWKFPGYYATTAPAVAEDGTVYFFGQSGLYAINPTGTAVWERPRGGESFGFCSPVVTNYGVIFVQANFGVAPMQITDGSLLWTSGRGCASVVARDGKVYVLGSQAVTMLGSDGAPVWTYTADKQSFHSVSVSDKGVSYVGANSGVIALNTDGKALWRFDTGKPVEATPVVDMEDNIYFGAQDGKFYSVTPEGVKRWTFDTRSSDVESTIIATAALAQDGTVYFGDGDGWIYALRPNGSLKWKFKAAEGISSSPNVGPDGTVYVLDRSGHLYALADDGGGLMPSAWPKYKHDAANTGVAK